MASPKRRGLWPVCACLAASLTTCSPTLPGARAAEGPTGPLAAREEDLARQFRDLEKTCLRLADLLAVSDPRRAAVLRSVFEQAREAEVGDRLDRIVKLLEEGQLLKAGASQAGALEKLRELLALLESGDTDKRRASEKEEVRQFLGRVAKLIARQRDVEGSTEAGAAEGKLAERQAALAEETQRLAGDIGSFARRMEPKDDAPPPRDDKRGEAAGESDKSEGGEKGGEKGSEQAPPAGARDGQPQSGTPAADKGSSEEGEEGSGDPQEPGGEQAGDKPDQEDPQGNDEASRARRTKRRLAAAEQRMRQAQERLGEARRKDARQEQEKAIEELETARAELEEILRQLREEEVERLLVQLEARLRAMLRAQRGVLDAAEKLSAAPAPNDRERQLEAVRLSREQTSIGGDAAKALTLVRDDGSAVAIPEALEQVRDDASQAAARLARGDVGGTTRGILQDLVANLEEMLAALEKAQAEQEARRQQPGGQGGRPQEPGEQPLVDKLAELKMIRSLQLRVNTRTRRFSKLLADGSERAEEPELLDALERLAERQRKIERAAHDIATGRTE